MLHTNSNYFKTHDRYLFQGQEMDDEISGSGNSIDFGNRMYDPRLGRMRSLDAFASKYPSVSPYAFVYNNPISNLEIGGDSVLFYSASGTYLGYSNDNQRYKDKNLLVIINDNHVKSFREEYKRKRMLPNLTLKQKEAYVAGLAEMGMIVFDVTSFTKFFDKYSTLKKDGDGKVVPYKGEFPPELQANMKMSKINGGTNTELNVISVDWATADTDNDPEGIWGQKRGEGLGSFHTHSGDGNPQGPGSPGDYDYAEKFTNGLFNVVMSKTQFNIYSVTGKKSDVENTLIQLNTKEKMVNLRL
jgi:RHS repeat-associated protein